MSLVPISRTLAADVDALRFRAPVTHVYNPLVYARGPHEKYLERYGQPGKEVVFVGMNPGPFGMAQTGVPFGDVGLVRDFLGVEAPVSAPQREHPKRRVTGFACPRSEVSGSRLWGWARDRFGAPGTFFERFFVLNYCPLVFMEESARNVTPDKLPANERAPLEAACDRALRESVTYLGPRLVVGVGAFAEDRAKRALEGMPLQIGRILHPSPASPLANRGWAAQAEAELRALGVDLPA